MSSSKEIYVGPFITIPSRNREAVYDWEHLLFDGRGEFDFKRDHRSDLATSILGKPYETTHYFFRFEQDSEGACCVLKLGRVDPKETEKLCAEIENQNPDGEVKGRVFLGWVRSPEELTNLLGRLRAMNE